MPRERGKKMRMNDKTNVQVRRPREVSQRAALMEAYTEVCLALDGVTDTMACGSDVVARWLGTPHLRLCKARTMISEILREGGEV